MKTVGVRELKNRLSEFLRDVKNGEQLLVTDRGEVIAELAAPGSVLADASVPPGIVSLAKRGVLTLASHRGRHAYDALRPLRGIPSATELLNESRESR